MAQRDSRLKAVCRFARSIRIEDDRHQAPPAHYVGARKKRRPPHIYAPQEIDRLIAAALSAPPEHSLWAQTYATLIAPLAAAGLRISETLKLDMADITPDGLLIRQTKFRKTASCRCMTPQRGAWHVICGSAGHARSRIRCSSAAIDGGSATRRSSTRSTSW